MKKLSAFALALSFVGLGSSCGEVDPIDTNNGVDRVEIGVMDLDPDYDVDTKATIAIESNVPQFYWADTDEVGIFPNQGGYQLGFSLKGQEGKKNASFEGGGWALRSDAAYSTYYPFRFENKNPESIPVNWVGQKQTGNNNLSHLGNYYFCATEPTSAEQGSVSFLLKNVGALVWFVITVPDPATYTEISLVTDDDLFTTAGTYDLKNFDLTVTPTSRANKVTLALDGVTTTVANQVINAYLMVAPFDLSGHSYKVYVKNSAGIYYSADLASKNHVLARNGNRKVTATVEKSENIDLSTTEYIDEYGHSRGSGIVIDGIVWAPVNCGYLEASATNGYSYGKLYQWGRYSGIGYNMSSDESSATVVDSFTGQNGTENNSSFYRKSSSTLIAGDWIVSGDDSFWNSGSENNPAKTAYDPCPDGWRLPTEAEINDLIQHGSEWTVYNGQNGRWFSGTTEFSQQSASLFLPASGYISSSGTSSSRGTIGAYWTSSVDGTKGRAMRIVSAGSSISSQERANAYSVRCVAINSDFQAAHSLKVTPPASLNVAHDGGSLTFIVKSSGVDWTVESDSQSVSFNNDVISNSETKVTVSVAGKDDPFRTSYKVIFTGYDIKCEYEIVHLANNRIGPEYIDEYGINHGHGTNVNGVVFAPVNCGYKAASTESRGFVYGKLFQWGRMWGQGYGAPYQQPNNYSTYSADPTIYDEEVPIIEEDAFSEFNGLDDPNVFYREVGNGREVDLPAFGDWLYDGDDKFWNKGTEMQPVKGDYDPCPDGWRTPTFRELKMLTMSENNDNHSEMTIYDGIFGMWFSGVDAYNESGPRVFLPAGGQRLSYHECGAGLRGGDVYYSGYYWSSSSSAHYEFLKGPYGKNAASIFFNQNGYLPVSPDDCTSGRAFGFSVRCVAE